MELTKEEIERAIILRGASECEQSGAKFDVHTEPGYTQQENAYRAMQFEKILRGNS